ncbi:hypothetical protein QUF80_08845 [Desulfococcaceae bacterium HSG8]|nr:hypothetical protein [Desulfococcaceae bacterium HSG8]
MKILLSAGFVNPNRAERALLTGAESRQRGPRCCSRGIANPRMCGGKCPGGAR